jgi:hypothetical protein
MGMSSYVMDCEEKFYDVVSDAVKEADDISDAMRIAVANRSMVANWTVVEIEECVTEFWNDFWSKFQYA